MTNYPFTKSLRCFRAGESGAYIVIFAIVLPLLMLLSSFSISLGLTALNKVNDQAAADIAVVSAATVYQTFLLDNDDKQLAKEAASRIGGNFFTQNKKVGSLSENPSVKVINDGKFQISFTNTTDNMFGSTGPYFSKLDYTIDSTSTVNEEEFLLSIDSKEILEAARKGEDLSSLLGNVSINAHYKKNKESLTEKLSTDNYDVFDGSVCKHKVDYLGFNINGKFTRGCIYHNNKSISISFLNSNIDAKYYSILLADIHTHRKDRTDEQGIRAIIYSMNDEIIDEFFVNNYGDLYGVDGSLSVTAQPLDDEKYPIEYNESKETLGLLDVQISSNTAEKIGAIHFIPTGNSFLLNEIHASKDIPGPVRLIE